VVRVLGEGTKDGTSLTWMVNFQYQGGTQCSISCSSATTVQEKYGRMPRT
jgi:hypothetical protein